MTQNISRRDMKRNELAETVDKTLGYVTEHKRGVTETVAIVACLAILAAGFFAYRTWISRSAGRDLSQALTILGTPLASEQQPGATTKTYPTDAARRAEAEAFLKKAAVHSSTPSGRAAQVILAAGGADKPGASVDAFEKAARQGKSETAAAAEIDAARALAAQGK